MKTLTRFGGVFAICAMLLVFVGCGAKDVDMTTEYTLTVDFEGQGNVDPSTGEHNYYGNTVVDLEAVPAEGWEFSEWIGPVANEGRAKTKITMNDDYEVKAIFVTIPGDDDETDPPEGSAARSHMVFEGEGYKADYDVWNCSGLEGQWQFKGEIVIADLGTISGEGSFVMPPRPDDGSWESFPYSYTMTGQLRDDVMVTDVNYIFEDIVVTMFEFSPGQWLMDSRGGATAIVTVTTPDFTHTVSDSYMPISYVPSSITYEEHPSC